MSIQANINAALGTVEGLILRAQKEDKELKPKAEPGTAGTVKQPTASPDEQLPAFEAPASEQPTGDENAKMGHSDASEDRVAEIMIKGNEVAGAIAAGRLAAARQIRMNTIQASRDRLAQLRQLKKESRTELRGVKHQERIVRHEIEKAQKGGMT